MENASRALLIAGGVLLTIIVISLFMLMLNNLTDYQQSKNQTQREKQLVAFNNQFEGYLRDDVSGVDMISLINTVVYYNRTQSTADTNGDGGSDVGYQPITLVLDFNGNKSKLTIDPSGNNLFKSDIYTFNEITSLKILKNDKNLSILYVEDTLKNALMPNPPTTGKNITLAPDYRTERKISYSEGIWKNLVDNYNSSESIFDENFTELKIDEKRKRFSEFNNAVGKPYFPLYDSTGKLIEEETINDWWENYFGNTASAKSYGSNEEIWTGNTIREDLEVYYEYNQFKRGIFEYVQESNKPLYDENTGRIVYMKFKFTGEFM